MKKLTTVLALAGILALNSSCASSEEPTATPTTTQPLSTDPPRDPEVPADAPTQFAEPPPQAVQLPNGPVFPAQPPGQGQRIIFADIVTRDIYEIPALRRVGVKIAGLSDDGSPVLANGQPWYINEIVSTPKPYELLIGEGVVTVVITVTFFGQVGESVSITVYGPGTAEGYETMSQVAEQIPGQRRGLVILNFPIALS